MSEESIPGAEKEGATAAEERIVAREAQLAKVPFLDGLTHEALVMVAEVTTEETHPTGTRIFQYGEPGDKLFIILEGKVRISREIAGMGEEALAVLASGEIFGEMALLDESPRSAESLDRRSSVGHAGVPVLGERRRRDEREQLSLRPEH